MLRLAIPIFRSRVSPVFDSCTSVSLMDLEQNREIARKEIFLDHLSLFERASVLEKSNVAVVICGGISNTLFNILRSKNIELITGIVGDIDRVITAYVDGCLDDPCFCMPGCRLQKQKRTCSRRKLKDKAVRWCDAPKINK